jgi:glycerol uptake facilitator-like aquaporin
MQNQLFIKLLAGFIGTFAFVFIGDSAAAVIGIGRRAHPTGAARKGGQRMLPWRSNERRRS